MSKGKAVHYTTIEAQRVDDPAAGGASIRWLIDSEHDGAPNFAMRMIELAPGGHSPLHTHPFEHQNFVVEGRGEVRLGDRSHPIGPGDVVWVPPGLLHQYRNTGDGVLRFLCTIPIKNKD
ncbi:MAG: cupin domain-containing protein [Deltaproteobacteria bacterium]|nr:MAG: cupin domain-containing protein [Deltaproteobacteria bacterium]